MFICNRFSEERSKFAQKRFHRPSVAKLCELFLAAKSNNTLFKLAKFVKIIMLQIDST